MRLQKQFVMYDKQVLRKKLLQARQQESLAIRISRTHQIAQSLFALPMFQKAKTIFCYCATEFEIGTDEILTQALYSKKNVCVPVCQTQGIMYAKQIHSLNDLKLGKFSIREPKEELPIIPATQIDLCIAPCLCANRAGYRLGYGGGYYDRFLAQTSIYTIALCAHTRFFVQTIQQEITDIPCNCILTERQVYYC